MGKMSFNQEVLDRLDKIIELLGGQFQPMSEARPEPIPNIEQALMGAQIDTSLLEIKGKTIKPTKWIGDQWASINDVLERHGYNWISANKESRWELGVAPQSPRPSEPSTYVPEWKPYKRGRPGEWTFATDREGNSHAEFANLIAKIQAAGGPVIVGSYRYELSGDNDKFLARVRV